MHICIQPAPIRPRSYQTEVHHLQDLRRQEAHCTRGNIHKERLGLLPHEAIWGSRRGWGPGSTVCHLRHGVWSGERREAVRHHSSDLTSAVECFSLILVPGCAGPRLFWSNGVLPARLSRWVVFQTRVSIGVAMKCWLYCRWSCSILPIGSNWPYLSISKYQLMQTAWWTSNGRLSWSRSVRMSVSWVWGNDRRCLSTAHEEGLFLYNKVIN